MKNKLRKKAQRTINKYVRALNKNIQKDNLWRGRFVFRQTDSYWEEFEDRSGGLLNVIIEARDLKTGKFWAFAMDNYDRGWRLFEKANKFIVDFSGVWDNINLVKNDKTDWSKVKWIPKERIPFGW